MWTSWLAQRYFFPLPHPVSSTATYSMSTAASQVHCRACCLLMHAITQRRRCGHKAFSSTRNPFLIYSCGQCASPQINLIHNSLACSIPICQVCRGHCWASIPNRKWLSWVLLLARSRTAQSSANTHATASNCVWPQVSHTVIHRLCAQLQCN